MKKSKRTVVFKTYNQAQLMLLPPSLDDLIEASHPVRVVNSVVDKVDLSLLNTEYSGGGASSYHPKMLLKVLIYSYLSNIYSSRKMAEGVKSNIHLMWLAGMAQPDHNTINRFRSERLKKQLKEIFKQVVLLLVESGHTTLKETYTDGTKIESKANRYTFVWAKSIETNKAKMYAQIEELWKYTEQVAGEEMADKELFTFQEIDKSKIDEVVSTIETALKDKEVDKKKADKLKYIKKNYSDKIVEYKAKEELLADRNSYSKTDTDATFMRMKEDHMGNGQLKPAYNVQISTNSQIILHYSIHSNPTDTLTLKPHLESFQTTYGTMPESLVADAGYGSEENLQYLEENTIEAFVKYNTFDKEQKGKQSPKDAFKAVNLYYNKEKDCFYCPMGQEMKNIGTVKQKTSSGYLQTITQYRAKRCEGCPLRGACHKAKGNRVIEINYNLQRLKEVVRQKLTDEEGIKKRKQRCVDVEPVFGNIKSNHHFKRFMLTGKEKVEIEFGLLALAQNMRKMCPSKKKTRKKPPLKHKNPSFSPAINDAQSLAA